MPYITDDPRFPLTPPTPGPWLAKLTAHGQWVVLYRDTTKPGLRMRRLDANVSGTFSKADAKLIAKAPDMLAALRRLLHPMADDTDVDSAQELLRTIERQDD